MPPIQNPTLDEFLRRARHEFNFLVVEFGFQEQPVPESRNGNPFEVRFHGGTTLVIVEGINWGYDVHVLLGPRRQPIFRSDDTFPLWPIVQLRRPDLNHALAIGDQLAQLTAWATALRASAEDVLRGDFSIRTEAEKIAGEVASSVAAEGRTRLTEWRYRDDVAKAREAFRAEDYATVVDLLMKHEATLSPAERVKLEYARKKRR